MQWELHLLGRFQLTIAGENVDDFEADSARALCAYLVMHAGETLRRERLATLFWPDQSQAGALRNLRTALSRLRRGLGALSHALQTDNQSVTFRLPPGAWVDALEAAALNAAVEAHAHRRREGCPFCIEKMQRIAALYRGEFLAGFLQESELFLEWAATQRENYHQAAIRALDALTTYHLLRQEWTAAQQHARRALQLEPWREESHRQMMLALAAQGQRSAALRQYHICQEILQREFDAPPQPETIALYEHILHNRQGADAANQARPAAQLTPVGAHWLDDLPFVGRQQELSELLARLVAPTTRLVTITGEGGVGKTRLALRAARHAALSFTDGAFYIALNPEEQPETSSPPLLDPVAHLAHQIALACAIPLSDQASPAQSLLAFLRTRSMLLVLDGFEQHERAAPFLLRLIETAPACTLILTSHRPLYVRHEHVLRLQGLNVRTQADDAQASPSECLALFDLLARRRGLDGVLDEAHRSAVLQVCAAVDGLPLGIELAVASLPHIDHAHAAAWSAEALTGLLLDADEAGQAVMVDLPPRHRNLRALFESAWRLLKPELQETLAGVAIFCAPFTVEMTAAVLDGNKPQQVTHHLFRLMERSLVQRSEQGRFRLHDRIRRYALEKLSASPAHATVRARCTVAFLQKMAQIAAALDGKDSYAVQQMLMTEMDDILAAWRDAVATDRWELVGGAAEAVANFHVLRGLYEEGEQLLGDTVRRLQAVCAAADAAGHRLAVRNGAATTARHFAATPASTRAVSIYAVAPMNGCASGAFTQALAQLSIAWSRLLRRAGRQEMAEAALREALALTDDSDTRVDALVSLGWCIYDQGRTREAEQPLNEALQLADHLGDARRRAYALNGLAAIHQRRGEPAQALRLLEEALPLCRAEGDLMMAAMILNNLNIACQELNNYERATALLHEALTIYDTLHNPRMMASTLYALGICYDASGRYTEAQAHYRQALAVADSIGDLLCKLEIWINIGISCDQMGDYRGALEATLRAESIECEMSNPQARCTLLANLSLIHHHLGNQAESLLYAQKTIEIANTIEMPLMVAYGYDFQGHALLALHRVELPCTCASSAD